MKVVCTTRLLCAHTILGAANIFAPSPINTLRVGVDANCETFENCTKRTNADLGSPHPLGEPPHDKMIMYLLFVCDGSAAALCCLWL